MKDFLFFILNSSSSRQQILYNYFFQGTMNKYGLKPSKIEIAVPICVRVPYAYVYGLAKNTKIIKTNRNALYYVTTTTYTYIVCIMLLKKGCSYSYDRKSV